MQARKVRPTNIHHCLSIAGCKILDSRHPPPECRNDGSPAPIDPSRAQNCHGVHRSEPAQHATHQPDEFCRCSESSPSLNRAMHCGTQAGAASSWLTGANRSRASLVPVMEASTMKCMKCQKLPGTITTKHVPKQHPGIDMGSASIPGSGQRRAAGALWRSGARSCAGTSSSSPHTCRHMPASSRIYKMCHAHQ